MRSHRESFRRPSVLTRTLVVLVRAYQRFGSPLFPPSCRFTPTCSEYATQALTRYGFARGLLLSIRRVVRCHPWADGGDDPVPN
jgi:putative membrane protein insertion efficiency factor